ncbi:hypothetical protein Selin_0129 [Desulfurispirillum indicum S5]|uniref:CobQ/CobB/MinD/ParA nucleotide binding domain-containing protein n=1 Tax=Desulfurispirillum indicum (strain ATCC BAA-1389 / DSM 22839 / S5) TaxID=653733 RepID=E6W5F6_DESIS|nr:hypothetical protein [Desulfurispirillum indicum]ADU64887.1 hypothetical protein Selin_0129 [Desulfurispirillum indicum S5]
MIFAITHPRNGSFKTTTAVNIAANLGIYEKKTLLVDVAGGDASTLLGCERSLPGITNIYRGGERIVDYVVPTRSPGVDLLPFGTGSFGFGMFWESLLEELQSEPYTYIVLDVNLNQYPPLGARYWNWMFFLNHRSPFQVEDARAMESMAHLVSSVADLSFRVINMGEHAPALEGLDIFETSLPIDSSIRRYTTPVANSQITSHLSRSFTQLTNEILTLS